MRDDTKIVSATKELRSRIMRSNKSKGNLSTELALVRFLRTSKITGWRRGVPLIGRPDFVFPSQRVILFVDGCYWHGCNCRRPPKSNTAFWIEKFQTNRDRDKRVSRRLRLDGWTVIRIWEHELKTNPSAVIKRINRSLKLSALKRQERRT